MLLAYIYVGKAMMKQGNWRCLTTNSGQHSCLEWMSPADIGSARPTECFQSMVPLLLAVGSWQLVMSGHRSYLTLLFRLYLSYSSLDFTFPTPNPL